MTINDGSGHIKTLICGFISMTLHVGHVYGVGGLHVQGDVWWFVFDPDPSYEQDNEIGIIWSKLEEEEEEEEEEEGGGGGGGGGGEEEEEEEEEEEDEDEENVVQSRTKL